MWATIIICLCECEKVVHVTDILDEVESLIVNMKVKTHFKYNTGLALNCVAIFNKVTRSY